MIDSGIFSKQDIILWESDLQSKDWSDAVIYFEASMEDEDKYTWQHASPDPEHARQYARTSEKRYQKNIMNSWRTTSWATTRSRY